MNSNRYLVIIKFFIVISAVSCTKEVKIETPQVFPKVKSNFYPGKDCNRLLMPDNHQLIDSSINFINISDTGLHVSYKWNFGDNNTSSQTNTTHAYRFPGNYNVQLITFYDNLPSDTSEKIIQIFTGQKNFNYWKNTYVTDADITPDNGVIALISGYNNYNDKKLYAILLTDSLLKKKWLKPLDIDSRLNSIHKTTGNEYILSGNYAAANKNQFSLSKLNSSGDHLWTKSINNLSGLNINTIETSDRNYLSIGYADVSQKQVAVVKCTINGNELWRANFNNEATQDQLTKVNNIIETSDGYVFGALSIYNADLVLTKLDFAGNVIQQGKIPLSSNITSTLGVGVSKSSTGYLVHLAGNSTGFFFNNSLVPTGIKQISNSSVNSVLSFDDSYYTAEGNHQYSEVRKITNLGTGEWSYSIKHYITLSCSSQLSGATRYGRKVIKGQNDFITLSDGEDRNTVSQFSVYIERISLDGQSK